jgi:hypothetical protein
MDRAQLLHELRRNPPIPGQTVYLQRHGEDYDASLLDPGNPLPDPGGAPLPPDAWIFYSGPWPEGDLARASNHLEDLLAEMESMSGGAERCRWPLVQPYPLEH